MSWTTNDIERRVLGVLIEKSLAQPDYYPMTLNAVVTACNQKNNRDPIMELDEDVVYNSLESLRERSIVTVVLPGSGARTRRYRHEAESYFGWSKPERAIMAELLLRGPQTIGELRGRCGRMTPLADAAEVTAVLDRLAAASPPCVAVMPRAAGQSVERYRQLLYDEQPVHAASAAAPAPPAGAGHPPTLEAESLRANVENLRHEVNELRDTVAGLTRRLESIERQLLS